LELTKKNKALNDENSDLQNLIGKATTFSLSDSDSNNSVQFVKDIENLQRMLEKYVGVLKPKIDINYKKVNELLHSYGCKVRVRSLEENGLLVKGVLQRYVLDEIFIYMQYCLDNKEICYYENEIYVKTKSLLDLIKKFSTKYDATNDIIKAYPIKIRQQVFGILGSLAFGNIQNEEHKFIRFVTNRLNKSINDLRSITNQPKKKLHDDMAADLIREVIRIFYYRLEVQQPAPETYWFEYEDKIDPNLVAERYDDENENDEDLGEFVELCYFPLIVSNYKSKNQKIYARAKIVHKFMGNKRPD
jgi:hypothetical protein